jgi:hypothetical protein
MGIKFANSAFATLAAGINSSVTSITLTTGQGARFPSLSAGDYFFATLIDASNNLEIVKCTARSTDVLTVTRGQESTTARAFSAGDRIELRITAQGLVDTADINFNVPTQTSNSGKFLTTNGSAVSWSAVPPSSVSSQVNTAVDYFDLPAGTTAQRPGTPDLGAIRYNSTDKVAEIYQNGYWNHLGQVVQQASVTQSNFFTSTNTSTTDYPNMSVSITPKSTDNFFIFLCEFHVSNNGMVFQWQVTDGSNNVRAPRNSPASGFYQAYSAYEGNASISQHWNSMAVVPVWSTSAQTLKVRYWGHSSSTMYHNRTVTSSTLYAVEAESTFIVLEVAKMSNTLVS